MTDTQPTPIPGEAIEAAAKELWRDYDSEYTTDGWDNLSAVQLGLFMDQARRVLEAAAPFLVEAGREQAMAGADIHEWGAQLTDGRILWFRDKDVAIDFAAPIPRNPGSQLPMFIRHITAPTPWEPVVEGATVGGAA